MSNRCLPSSVNGQFVVFAMPRSRSKWLSHLLTFGEWKCKHDELRYMRSMEDLASHFAQPKVGTVETGAAPFWRLLPKGLPVVVLRRPVEESLDSYFRAGLQGNPEQLRAVLRKLAAKLDQISHRMPNVLEVDFSQLAKPEICFAIAKHCTGEDLNWGKWVHLAGTNIQDDLVALQRYCLAYRGQLAKLANMAKTLCISEMERSRPNCVPEGFTFRQESIRELLRDGVPLFAEHLVEVGEDPAQLLQKNLPLLRQLDDEGRLQVTVARSNGKVFGYLVTLINPRLDDKDLIGAYNTTFYCRPDVKGLGLSLQRESLRGLRAKGVSEVLWRTGNRGRGDKLSVLYERLGAASYGEVYKLNLGGV